jgi:hypothetical protein
MLDVHWCSVAVQNEDEDRNLSPYRSFITGSGAYHGTEGCRKLSRKQWISKNRDKFIYFIVRVSTIAVIDHLAGSLYKI